jgi:hypothetical protein
MPAKPYHLLDYKGEDIVRKYRRITMMLTTLTVLTLSLVGCSTKVPESDTTLSAQSAVEKTSEPETPEPEPRELPSGGTVIGDYTWYPLPDSSTGIVAYKTDWVPTEESPTPEIEDVGVYGNRIDIPGSTEEIYQILDMLMGGSAVYLADYYPSDAKISAYIEHKSWGWTSVVRYTYESPATNRTSITYIVASKPKSYTQWNDANWILSDLDATKAYDLMFDHFGDAGSYYRLYVNTSAERRVLIDDLSSSGLVSSAYALIQSRSGIGVPVAYVVMTNPDDPKGLVEQATIRVCQW